MADEEDETTTTTTTTFATTPSSENGGGGNDSFVISIVHPQIYLPIYVMTGIFGAIFIIAPFLIRKGPNQGLIRCSIWLSTFSFWVLWFTMYVAQMNPLMGPRIKNTTLAWIAYSWGKIPETPGPTPVSNNDTTPNTTTTTTTEESLI